MITPPWLFFIIAAAAFFAVNDSIRRFLAPQFHPVLITSILALFTAILSFFWLLFSGKSGEYVNGWQRLWPVFVFASVAIVLGTVSQLKGFSFSPPLHVAMPILVVVLATVATLIGFLFFHEAFHVKWFFGFLLALLGTILMMG